MILYMLTAYCSVCGHDFAEKDDEDPQFLADRLPARAEVLYAAHITEGKCGG